MITSRYIAFWVLCTLLYFIGYIRGSLLYSDQYNWIPYLVGASTYWVAKYILQGKIKP